MAEMAVPLLVWAEVGQVVGGAALSHAGHNAALTPRSRGTPAGGCLHVTNPGHAGKVQFPSWRGMPVTVGCKPPRPWTEIRSFAHTALRDSSPSFDRYGGEVVDHGYLSDHHGSRRTSQ